MKFKFKPKPIFTIVFLVRTLKWIIGCVIDPPLWRNLGGRRRFRVTIGHLVAGSIRGRAYVKEIPSAEHKQQSVMGCRVCQLILQKKHSILNR